MGKSSKRSKDVSLTKVKPKGKELKTKIIDQFNEFLSQFPTVIAFQYHNFKTHPFQEIREMYTNSKFLLGKSSVLKKAIIQAQKAENRPNLDELANHMVGSCGLMFTRENKDDIISHFLTWRESSSLNPGQVASEDVIIPAGAGTFTKFSNTIEPYLRNLGLPTRLHEGVIEVLKDFTVCRAGEEVNPEKCRILRLLDIKQGEMRIIPKGIWENGQYKEL
ncbi:unnamed protein product [Blepharisma stoltei]|uniref:Large ribosomal subunit protein uL10-like insertion domain-containing protein n=1 Tax=Blepharisma stoltei TaxID=1481888 RepID=A0AAU9KCI4_9CILI|nr:unnamed protein product [Blepharisma stoltei]